MGVEKIHLQFWNAQTFLYLFYLTDYALKLILVGPILCFIKVTAFKTSWPYLWTYFWCFYSFEIRRASQTTLYKIALALRPLLMTLRMDAPLCSEFGKYYIYILMALTVVG